MRNRTLFFVLAIIAVLALNFFFAVNKSHAVEFKTIEDYGFYIPFQGSTCSVTGALTNLAHASFTVSGILLSYVVEAQGSDATFEVRYVTGTADSSQIVSSITTVTDGYVLGDNVRGFVKNPLIAIRSLAQHATAYVRMWYLRPNRQ